jgi:hypothetical protein
MTPRVITLPIPGVIAVELPEGAIKPHVNHVGATPFIVYHLRSIADGYHQHNIQLPPGNWQLIGRLSEMCNCFVCGGDGKETCNNPDHGFLGAIGGVVGANESACPVCGHNPNHKVPNGGECECCDGIGFLTVNQFIDACEEYGYDDSPEEVNSTHPAIKSAGLFTENPYGKELHDTYKPKFEHQIKGSRYEQWQAAQQRTICPERTVLLRKVK